MRRLATLVTAAAGALVLLPDPGFTSTRPSGAGVHTWPAERGMPGRLRDGTTAQNPDERTIHDLEQRLARAWVVRDRPFIEDLLAPEWTVTDPSGNVLTKAQVLDEAFKSTERQIESMTIDEVRVRLYDGTAVATGRTRATGSYKGQRANATLRFTDVFVKRAGRWQIVASHGTLVSSP